MKKILALMLSVMMVVCMMPSMAFAEGETTLSSGNLTVVVSQTNFTYNGSAQKPTVTVKYTPTSTDSSGESASADVQPAILTEGTDYTIGYQRNSSDTNDFISAGEISIATITGKGNYTGTVTISDKSYTISPKSLTDSTVTEGYMAPVTGTESNDDLLKLVKLNDSQTGKALVAGTDFELKETTTSTADTTKSITIKGKGNYSDSSERTITFTVGKNLQGNTTITTYPSSFTYNGTDQKPSSVSVTYNGTVLKETQDYVVSYENCRNAGIAKVIIEGRGNYAGKVEKTYPISKKSISSVSVASIPNQVVGATPTPEIKDTGITGSPVLTQGNDYTLEYSGNTAVGRAKLIIRANENGNYTGYKEVYFDVRNRLYVSVVPYPINEYTYTGSVISPTVTVTPALSTDTYNYILNRDYQLVGVNNINVGTYTYKVIGMGNFSGEYGPYTYKIVARSLSTDLTAKATLSSDTVLYDGKKAEPAVTVTCGGRTLVKNVDYTVSYYNNDKIGTATLYIYGKGNYTGSITKTFRIVGKDLSSLSATLSQTTYNYTGLEHKPTVTIYDGYKKLTSGTDYTVAYKDNKNCGTATVTITGKGNYSGTKTLTFTIVGKDQSITTNYTYYTKYLTSSAFNLGAKTDGDGVIVYESSDPSVATVSSTGTVTVHGTGVAYITVKTTKDVKYNPASKVVTVTVKPKKPAFKVTSPAKGQVKVTITKVDGATKYQVRYGRMGSYSNRYITHNDNGYSTTYVTLKNLKPGTNYFVKVRSYKKLADGTIVWGNWTVIKKIKTK